MHPSLTRFAVTGRSGLLQLWDYAERRLLIMRMYDKLLGNAVAFSPSGKFVAVGFTNGMLKLLAGMTLEEIASFKASKDCIMQVSRQSPSCIGPSETYRIPTSHCRRLDPLLPRLQLRCHF